VMLRLYGVPLSQPFRSVAWALMQHKVPFKVEVTVPGSTGKAGSKAEPFISKPMGRLGMIPMIEEESGFTLAESPAILTYLAETRGWPLLPSAAAERARISSFMHWHHSGTRTIASVFANYVRPDMKCSEDELSKRLAKAAQTLETLQNVWLADGGFIAGQASATIADFVCYEEVTQVQPHYLNLGVDLTPFPKVVAWCERMSALPMHDEAHVALSALGDLRTPNEVALPKRLSEATKAALKAYAEAQKAY